MCKLDICVWLLDYQLGDAISNRIFMDIQCPSAKADGKGYSIFNIYQ